MYFNFWTSNFFKIFRFLRHLPRFCSVSDYFILDFFWLFGHYSSDNTEYRYLNKVAILNDPKRYRYSIDSIDTISHHYYIISILVFLSNTITKISFEHNSILVSSVLSSYHFSMLHPEEHKMVILTFFRWSTLITKNYCNTEWVLCILCIIAFSK